MTTTWFLLWGLLWAIYFVLDGFDLGLGTALPCLGRTDTDKRKIFNAMGPFWDGNEVWLIAAGGVTFAAFPHAYAVMFSGLYLPLFLLLFALIVRGVSFEFRHLIDHPVWHKFWDMTMFIGSFVPALLFGVAFANIFRGLPIKDGVMNVPFLDLLNIYGLAGGIFFVVMFMGHGTLWLTIKVDGDLQKRAANMSSKIWALKAILVVAFLLLTAWQTRLFGNYLKNPILFLLLLIPVGGLIMEKVYAVNGKWGKAWISSAALIFGVTMFGIVGLYPALLPSTFPAHSITIFNSASSPLTLEIMLGVVVVFLPIVIGYQYWVYKQFKFKLTDEVFKKESIY